MSWLSRPGRHISYSLALLIACWLLLSNPAAVWERFSFNCLSVKLVRNIGSASENVLQVVKEISSTKRERQQHLLGLAGALALAAGDYERAIPLLERSVEYNDARDTEQFLLGQARYQLGDVEGALASWRQANVAPLFELLGKQAMESGRYADAEVAYLIVTSLKPDDGCGYASLAEVYRATGQLELAVEMALKARTLNPDCEEAYLFLGLVYERTGNLKSAESVYLDALGRFPRNSSLWFTLGDLYLHTGWKDPEPFFLETLVLNPRWPLAHYHISTMYRSRGDLQRAISHMQTSIDELLPASRHTCEKLMSWLPILIDLYQTAGDEPGKFRMTGVLGQVEAECEKLH